MGRDVFEDDGLDNCSEAQSRSGGLQLRSSGFTVPEGYFAALRERVMNRIGEEESRRKEVQARIVKMSLLRRLVAVAACVLLVFTAATLYVKHAERQHGYAETETADEDFYYEAIIQFLERDNFTVTTIMYSLDSEMFH